MLESCKRAMRIKTDAYDAEIEELIAAALEDLGIAGVLHTEEETVPPLIRRAVVTYVRLHFGTPDDYDRLKLSYDEQKAQLQTSRSYTTYPEEETE